MSSSHYQRDVMPYYAGLVSFFRLPAIEFDDIGDGMAVIAGVPIDNGIYGGRPGARFGPGGISETEILIAYGATSFASKTGPQAGNHFLTIVEGMENLAALGQLVLWEGAQNILFEAI